MTDWMRAWQEFMLEAERQYDQHPGLIPLMVNAEEMTAARRVFGDVWCDMYLQEYPPYEPGSLMAWMGTELLYRAWEYEHLTGGMTGEPRGVLAALHRDATGPSRGGTGTMLPDWATQRRPA